MIFNFTFPYLVAVLKGDNAEEYLLRAELGAKIISLDSFKTAIRGLSEGKYDAVVIQKLLALLNEGLSIVIADGTFREL